MPNLQSSRARGSGGHMKPLVSFSLQFLLAVIFPLFCIAQNNSQDAHLSGTITDSSGAGVGGVHISAVLDGQSRGNIWKATSTTDGAYSLAFPPGKYHIELTRASFATRSFDLEFAGGETRKL